MHHAADVYGCMLVINGGISGEEKDILNDFSIYDLSNSNLYLYYRKVNMGRDFYV